MASERTVLDRRMLLKGLAASAGVAILSACGDEAAPATATRAASTVAATTGTGGMATTAATTAPTTGGSVVAAVPTTATTATRAPSAVATTAATTAPTTGGSVVAATTAPTVVATRAPSAVATTAATTAATATTAPATAASTAAASPAAATTTTGTVTGMTAPAVPAVIATGGMPMGPAASACVMGSIVSLGSTALQPLVEQAARVYAMRCMGAQINVQGGGSGTGLTQVFMGGAQIGASDIFAEERDGIDAKQLTDYQVCAQGFGIAANPTVAVTNLTQDQVIGIFAGRIMNYREVGGPDQAVVVVNRPASSGTRATFQKYALRGMREAQGKALTEDSTGAVAEAIRSTPGAIGYLALAAFAQQPDLKVVNFNGRAPTLENISNDSYPIWSYGHLYTKGPAMGLAKSFIDYMLTDDVQNTVVPNLGYFPITKIMAKKTP